MSDKEEKVDYSNTLNLPKTDFPMRGNLPENEPKIQKEKFTEGFYENKTDTYPGTPYLYRSCLAHTRTAKESNQNHDDSRAGRQPLLARRLRSHEADIGKQRNVQSGFCLYTRLWWRHRHLQTRFPPI